MWSEGIITVADVKVSYQVKHYNAGSEFGIDEGRISKLWMQIDGKYVVGYERGWDIQPDENNPVIMAAYKEILKKYN